MFFKIAFLTQHNFLLYAFSDGSGTQHPGFGFWKCREEMGLRQFKQGFSSFFAKSLGIFDDFSKWSMPKGAPNL